ncbi:hypothetical protein Acr_08g0011030 [Actinidia rufa]|uniref:Uncharacterized protein n=1 Tax=Actinidia rufa TaxID=165716 RepID=A0A7J0F467_9ERIC|nr:hypothetical protein Acr_08g0011030 [Actinidia rufa]
MNSSIGEAIGNHMGKYVATDIDAEGCGWGKFLRVRVLVSVEKHLLGYGGKDCGVCLTLSSPSTNGSLYDGETLPGYNGSGGLAEKGGGLAAAQIAALDGNNSEDQAVIQKDINLIGANPSYSPMEGPKSMIDGGDKATNDGGQIIIFYFLTSMGIVSEGIPTVEHGISDLKLWVKKEECEQIIQSAWSATNIGRDFMGLKSKIQECRMALLKWKKEVMGKVSSKIRAMQARLAALKGVAWGV